MRLLFSPSLSSLSLSSSFLSLSRSSPSITCRLFSTHARGEERGDRDKRDRRDNNAQKFGRDRKEFGRDKREEFGRERRDRDSSPQKFGRERREEFGRGKREEFGRDRREGFKRKEERGDTVVSGNRFNNKFSRDYKNNNYNNDQNEEIMEPEHDNYGGEKSKNSDKKQKFGNIRNFRPEQQQETEIQRNTEGERSGDFKAPVMNPKSQCIIFFIIL